MLRPTTSVVRALTLTFAASTLPSGLFAQSSPVITGKAAFADYSSSIPASAAKLLSPTCRSRIRTSRSTTDPASFRGPRARGRSPPRASRWRCTRRASGSRG